MGFVRHSSLLENTFKYRIQWHEVIPKWIQIIKDLKGEDLIQYVQNYAAKDMLLFFFMMFKKRVEKNPNVVLYKKAHEFACELVQERWKSV